MILYDRHYLAIEITDEHSMRLIINISEWFPNTKAKCNQLLKIMREYSSPAELGEVLTWLYFNLDNKKATFGYRENIEKPAFNKMLSSNKSLISMFNGLYGGEIWQTSSASKNMEGSAE